MRLLREVILAYGCEYLDGDGIFDNLGAVFDTALYTPTVPSLHLIFDFANGELQTAFDQIAGLLVGMGMQRNGAAFL